jgi:carnitine O-acetyltransferase
VVVNVSYFFSFVDDPTVDTSTQRAAAILFGTALYRKQVCSGNLAAGRVGRKNTLLCSTAYKYMFNACRIPLQGQDRYRIFDPSSKTHAVVARKGHFFSIEIVDRCGDPLPIAILESQLQQCIALADSIPNSRAKIGIMTSDNRDDWAAARAELLQLGGAEMKEALEILESGAIMLNLDDEAPVSRQECGSLFWTGGLTSGQNRYFDKSIQIMVANNGKAGLIAEHSMMDGMPVIGYADFVCKMSYARARIQSPTSSYKKVRPIDIFEKPLSEMDRKAVGKLESKGVSFSSAQ